MIIIPGFGAFISEYQSAEIDNASDEIKPPSTRLIFNPQIRNNDGLLVGYVAEITRNSHFEALQKIEKERDNIIYQLDKGEKVELEDLGTLYYNADNQIEFISESDKNISHESFGLESISLTEPEQPEKIEEENETPDAIVENNEETEEQSSEQEQETEIDEPVETEISEEDSTEVEETKEDQESEETEKTVILPPVTDQQEETEEGTVEKETLKEEPALVEDAHEPEKEKKRKGGWIWILAVLIPLIAVSAFLLMKEKKSTTPVVNKEQPSQPEIKEEPMAIADSTAKDSATLVPVNNSVVTEPDTVQTDDKDITRTSEAKFYLIGGSFKEKENAATYMQVLRDKGFEPFEMGKYGNFYILGIGAYNTEEEAIAAKREFLDKSPDSGIWVLEK